MMARSQQSPSICLFLLVHCIPYSSPTSTPSHTRLLNTILPSILDPTNLIKIRPDLIKINSSTTKPIRGTTTFKMLLTTFLSTIPLLALVSAEPLGVAPPRALEKRQVELSGEMIDKVRTLAYNLNNKR